MTLKFMQGFETVRDDTDLRSQGWIAAPVKMFMTGVPSTTGLAGTAVKSVGAFQGAGTNEGSAGVPDPVLFNTNITINQAWTAGGFTYGINARFNSAIAASFASSPISGTYSAGLQMCFDGTRYWALRNVAGSINVYFSTDLTNWTVSPSQPASMLVSSAIAFVANNIVVTTGGNGNAVSYYYSSNNGASWTTGTVASNGVGSPCYGIAFATTNATFPLGIAVVGFGSSNPGGLPGGMVLYAGTFGTLVNVSGLSSPAGGSANLGATRILNGTIYNLTTSNNGALIYQATANNASLNTTGAWTSGSVSGVALGDIAYSPVSNLFILATSAGISTIPNGAGTAGTAHPFTGAVTATSRYSTVGMNNVYVVGSTVVAVGSSGHIITSADGGITWTESGGHILPVGVSGTNWIGAYFDGTQYILTSDTITGVIVTTPDLQTNYQAKYAMDSTEQATGLQGQMGVSTSAAYVAPPFTVTDRMFVSANAVSSGNRVVNFAINSSIRGTTTLAVNTGSLNHYYEIHAKSTATANQFNFSFYVDGILAFGPFTGALGSPTDVMTLTFCRTGQFVSYDDIYFTLNDGVAGTLQGPAGIINIVVQRPSADVSTQWTKTGSAASNALSVNQTAQSSLSTNSVSSNTPADKDVYSTTDTLPAGYTPKAIQNEAYFARVSSSSPTVQIGTVSGASETDSTAVTISSPSPTYVSQIVEKDPNGNAAWATSSVNAAKFAITHTT